MNERLKKMVDDLENEFKDKELHMISISQSDRKTRQKERCSICGKASESDTARITYLYGTLDDQHRKTILTVCDKCRSELRERLNEYEAECEMCERMYQEEKKIFIGEIKKAYKESQKNPDGDGSFYIKGNASDEFSRHIIEEKGFEILERKNDVFIGEDELTGEKYYGPRYRIRKEVTPQPQRHFIQGGKRRIYRRASCGVDGEDADLGTERSEILGHNRRIRATVRYRR